MQIAAAQPRFGRVVQQHRGQRLLHLFLFYYYYLHPAVGRHGDFVRFNDYREPAARTGRQRNYCPQCACEVSLYSYETRNDNIIRVQLFRQRVYQMTVDTSKEEKRNSTMFAGIVIAQTSLRVLDR